MPGLEVGQKVFDLSEQLWPNVNDLDVSVKDLHGTGEVRNLSLSVALKFWILHGLVGLQT